MSKFVVLVHMDDYQNIQYYTEEFDSFENADNYARRHTTNVANGRMAIHIATIYEVTREVHYHQPHPKRGSGIKSEDVPLHVEEMFYES